MICVVIDDLASAHADAIVRPADSLLEPLTDAAAALDRAAGPGFTSSLHTAEELAVGSAVVTDAGALNADLVIHAVLSSSTEAIAEKGIRRAMESILHRAQAWQIDSVAVPPLGHQSSDLELEEIAKTMIAVVAERQDTAEYPAELRFVVGEETEKKLFERLTLGVSS
ncbi:MAG: macro domain-containing protein [Gemmatimonadales bacterium]